MQSGDQPPQPGDGPGQGGRLVGAVRIRTIDHPGQQSGAAGARHRQPLVRRAHPFDKALVQRNQRAEQGFGRGQGGVMRFQHAGLPGIAIEQAAQALDGKAHRAAVFSVLTVPRSIAVRPIALGNQAFGHVEQAHDHRIAGAHQRPRGIDRPEQGDQQIGPGRAAHERSGLRGGERHRLREAHGDHGHHPQKRAQQPAIGNPRAGQDSRKHGDRADRHARHRPQGSQCAAGKRDHRAHAHEQRQDAAPHGIGRRGIAQAGPESGKHRPAQHGDVAGQGERQRRTHGKGSAQPFGLVEMLRHQAERAQFEPARRPAHDAVWAPLHRERKRRAGGGQGVHGWRRLVPPRVPGGNCIFALCSCADLTEPACGRA